MPTSPAGQTVLTAFQQVEDNLAAVRLLSQQILKQDKAVKSSAEGPETRETARYETGVDPYLDVVAAQDDAAQQPADAGHFACAGDDGFGAVD